MNSEFDMTGKVAMVTGASSGFGVNFAKILAARGAKVVVAARRLDRLEALVAEIKADGGEAFAVSLDVTNAESITAAFDASEAAFGTVQLSLTMPVLPTAAVRLKPLKRIGIWY